ncbi:MAG: enoyl-CoA hydratase/isomerase family protein, partial [Rhizobiales bacterium]|nr:enoyl-CoA hydratase/isomerase family protein [Hyphomicrobiales bacterium]
MDHVLTRIEGRAGRITLARPEALNALDHAMTRAIASAMEAFAADDAVGIVIIDAAGDRAFCAGGDVRRIWHASRAGDPALGRLFWRDEYRLNARLAAFPKPVVSLMQGFVMGGGVGLGCHLSHRILDPVAEVAMPEAAIGFLPDVGGSLLLARAPDRIGIWMGLTALRLGAADAVHAGFADRVVPRAAWPDLIAGLGATADPALIDAAAVELAPGPVAARGAE